MREVRTVHTACPLCGHNLKGSAFEGYRCIKCKHHYTAAFVRKLRRLQFAEMVDDHFTQSLIIPEPDREEVLEEVEFSVDAKTVERAEKEAHLHAQLEDVVREDAWPDVRELLRESMDTTILQSHQKTVPEYEPPKSARKTKRKTSKKRKKSTRRR